MLCGAAYRKQTGTQFKFIFFRSLWPPNPSPAFRSVPFIAVCPEKNTDHPIFKYSSGIRNSILSHTPASSFQARFIRPRDILRALRGAVAIPEPTGADTSLPFLGVISLLTCVWCMLLARPLRSRIIASASSLDIVGLSAGSREEIGRAHV